MNEIVNRFLLEGDKFMPEMHLKQPGFGYNASGPFTKNNKKNSKFMQTGNINYIYKNDLDKACFHHDMAYGKYRDLTKRTQSDKFVRVKAFKIANNPNFNVYERRLAFMVYKFFDKRCKGSAVNSILYQQLADELHKPII